jgi:hypothetical protein
MLTVVSLDAAPFQNQTHRLRFRAIAASLAHHDLEGSEACLIHADMQAYSSKQTFINSLVRVSYTKAAHKSQDTISQIFIEKFMGGIVAFAYDIRNIFYRHRLAKYVRDRHEKVLAWEGQTGLKEEGEFCLEDQMQVLTPWGWAHV